MKNKIQNKNQSKVLNQFKTINFKNRAPISTYLANLLVEIGILFMFSQTQCIANVTRIILRHLALLRRIYSGDISLRHITWVREVYLRAGMWSLYCCYSN